MRLRDHKCVRWCDEGICRSIMACVFPLDSDHARRICSHASLNANSSKNETNEMICSLVPNRLLMRMWLVHSARGFDGCSRTEAPHICVPGIFLPVWLA